ncbi:hypothetical protein KAR02_12650, partial [Candidatus Bipolaricaulota bacterium]|nr:hypothetical protein [Candidatus Bipolaricaulota bacterium]
ERAVPIPEDHDSSDRDRAISLALEVPDRFPIGVLYEQEPRETFGEIYRQEHGAQVLFTIPPIERGTIERKLEKLRIGAKN